MASGQQPRKIKWKYIVPIIVALILAISGIIGAIISKSQPQQPTPIITLTSPTATPQPLCSDNLITCSSNVVAIFTPGQSSSFVTVDPTHSTLQFTFNNTKNGTGLALQFAPPLDVTPYHFVEISGTSTQQFSFEVQYKVKDTVGNPQLVKNSGTQNFPVSTQTLIERVPIAYNRSVDEVV